MYREWDAGLDGAVVWTRAVVDRGADREPVRILPDGCLDIVWREDGQLFVAGPDTTAQYTVDSEPLSYVGIRFAPGQGPSVLGVAARELTDRRVPLDELWAAGAARHWQGRVAGATDRPAALVALARERLRETAPDRLVCEVVRRLDRGGRVDDTAEAVSLSLRQLHRLSLHRFGYGPKTLARVLRFNRALALARTGAGFSRVAAETGYADQAHLARDVRGLAGTTLTDLLSG